MFHTQLLPIDSAHLEHTLTLLPGGDALVAGGLDAEGVAQAQCVRYVAAAADFVAAAPLPLPSRRHSATRLLDGAILVVGVGEAEGGAALYEPVADRWITVPAPTTPRIEHAATLLADGTVLIAGGRPAAALAAAEGIARREVEVLSSSERFDPADRSWKPGPLLAQPRRKFALFTLPGGGLLAVGGKGTSPAGTPMRLKNAEVCGADLKAFQALPRMEQSERDLCQLADGRVIGHAGHVFTADGSAFERHEAGFRGGGPMLTLGDGRVGCFGQTGDEVYDAETGAWAPSGPARKLHQRGQLAVLLENGEVLVVGGSAGRGKAAPYAALVAVDLEWQPAEIAPEEFESAEKLLEMLVEQGALELDDEDEGVEPLVGPVARVLAYTEGAGAQAGAMSRLLLEHDAVADFYLDDQQLRRLLAQW
ncbi:MAG: hypothetical protein H6747_04390 [Deltaproteobacteria bacterium]|nr:hypothetical protein [Deltaproteobacteria bacterium]